MRSSVGPMQSLRAKSEAHSRVASAIRDASGPGVPAAVALVMKSIADEHDKDAEVAMARHHWRLGAAADQWPKYVEMYGN